MMMLFLLFGSASVHFQPAMPRRPVVPCQPASTADKLFDSVVDLCIAHKRGVDVDFERVPWLFDEVLRQDEAALRELYVDRSGYLRAITNLTCLQPLDGDGDGVQQTFNEELLALPTREGRACVRGACSCACSRVTLSLASEEVCARLVEHAAALQPPAASGTHNLHLKLCAAAGELPTTLLFVRLLERMRRATAIEFGVPLRSLSPRQAFISRVLPHSDPERASIHADECSVPGYHYSAVLYLSTSVEALQADQAGAVTAGEAARAARAAEADFAGGELRFYGRDADPDAPRASVSEVVLPRRGTAALFSSGWENVHQVARVTAGQRHSLPAFFTTEQPPTPAPWGVDKRGGAPECRAARAAALWELGLMPRSEGDFMAFMWHWAQLFDPGAWSGEPFEGNRELR